MLSNCHLANPPNCPRGLCMTHKIEFVISSFVNHPLDHLPYWSKLFAEKENILPGSEVGKANGLTVLLDAETYDYTYHLRAGEGFKVLIQWFLMWE